MRFCLPDIFKGVYGIETKQDENIYSCNLKQNTDCDTLFEIKININKFNSFEIYVISFFIIRSSDYFKLQFHIYVSMIEKHTPNTNQHSLNICCY